MNALIRNPSHLKEQMNKSSLDGPLRRKMNMRERN